MLRFTLILTVAVLLISCSRPDAPAPAPAPSPESRCPATYTSLIRREDVEGEYKFYIYSKLGSHTREHLRCLITQTFGAGFESVPSGKLSLLFSSKTTKEALVYSLTKYGDLSVVVISAKSPETFEITVLNYRAPITVLLETFNRGSVFIPYQYKKDTTVFDIPVEVLPEFYSNQFGLDINS